MATVKNYIPKSKSDEEAVENLYALPFEMVKQDAAELLIWLQDMNWPIAHSVAMYLLPHISEMEKELLDIFKTDDLVWQYWIMHILMKQSSFRPGTELLTIIKRLAEHPSTIEQNEELDISAKELLRLYSE